MAKSFRVAVDFDGTIVEHRFPEVGKPVPGALEWLHKWQDAGATLILWTMRSPAQNNYGDCLEPAVAYCEEHGIHFDGVNEGPDDRSWTTSPKVYAHVYVDDAAFGCPLTFPDNGDRPHVDWDIVGPAVLEMIKDSG
jgi:hypothetical protein